MRLAAIIGALVSFACTVGISAYLVLSGLPAEQPFSGPQESVWAVVMSKWTLNENIVLFALLAAADGLSLALFAWLTVRSICSACAETSARAAEVMVLLLNRVGLAADMSFLRLFFLVILGVAAVATAMNSVTPIMLLGSAVMGMAALSVLFIAVRRLTDGTERLLISSRVSPVGGGQREWHMSSLMGLLLLTALLFAAIAAVGAAAFRPDHPDAGTSAKMPGTTARPAAST